MKRENINLYLFTKDKPLPNQTINKSITTKSDYNQQLTNKRRIKLIYNTTEYFIKKLCILIKYTTTIYLNFYFFLYLERRLDNILYRTKLFSTRASAKQYISHNNLTINNIKITHSYLINDLDQLTFKNITFYNKQIPSWLIKINDNIYIFRSYLFPVTILTNINPFNIISFYNKNN